MKVGIVAFSEKGGLLGRDLKKKLEALGHQAEGFLIERYQMEELRPFQRLDKLTAALFEEKDMLVFIGASGIAVRAIAPCIRSKINDPGVLVMDECGCYVISLLSGHMGGANAFTRLVAKLTEAEPVITTATDRNGVFAVDDWARENRLRILNPAAVKGISARILAGESIGFYSDIPVSGSLPKGLKLTAAEEAEILLLNGKQLPKMQDRKESCLLLPMDLVAGMGCRKGKDFAALHDFLQQSLQEEGLLPERLGKICSVSMKEKEKGLLELAKALQIPFETYEASTLQAMEGEFTGSEFVRQQTGTDNVCERAASYGSGYGKKLLGKKCRDGMTIAVYQRKLTLSF